MCQKDGRGFSAPAISGEDFKAIVESERKHIQRRRNHVSPVRCLLLAAFTKAQASCGDMASPTSARSTLQAQGRKTAGVTHKWPLSLAVLSSCPV